MERISTITSKGQVVIPKEIRELYNLGPKTKISFEPAGEHVVLKPVVRKAIARLKKKLANFQVDPNFRKNWEKALENKMKRWGW